MKILHVFHHANLLNGVDRTTLTLLRALLRRGEEVVAIVPRVGDVTSALDEAGVTYHVAELGCCNGPTPMAELAYLSRASVRASEIESWLRDWKVDVVHLNTGHLLDAAIAAARVGVPVIWHIHAPFEVDLARYERFMATEGYAWLLDGLGSRVIGVSDDVRASLLPHVPAQKVATLFNGVDVADLDVRAAQPASGLRAGLGLKDSVPVVLGVGRISVQKDFATFARVARAVIAQHPTVAFAIAGPAEDADLHAGLLEQARDPALKGRLFVLGPRSDVPALLAQCDLFLSTALFEGHPLTSLEAMSQRVPVVSMDCVGLRECIRSGTDGLLVPLGDEMNCARAVMNVLTDAALASRLGEAGRQTVIARFSADAYAQGFLDIARQAMADFVPGRNAPAASFALGLLKEIGEAHRRLTRLTQAPQGLWARARSRLFR